MAERIHTAVMTNEELVSLIQRGVETEDAYQQTIGFDADDFLVLSRNRKSVPLKTL